MAKCYFKDSYSGVCNLITGKSSCYGCKWYKTKEQFYSDMDRTALMLFKKGLVKYTYKNADGNVHVKAIPINKEAE
jgi:hypothetical protein